MSKTISASEDARKLVKQILVEALEESRPLLQRMIREELEDMALLVAMREGAKTKRVSRATVFRTLRGQP